MSQDPKPIKKKVVTAKPTVSQASRRSTGRNVQSFPLLFDRQNYLLMAAGFGLILFGLILMLGGGMKDPNVWDESIIYSARRITLAPIVILAGLGLEIYAIFKK